jgi:hypothetical protein
MTVMHPTTNWMGAPCALQVVVVTYKDGHSALALLVIGKIEKSARRNCIHNLESLKKLRADADDIDGVHHMNHLFRHICNST